MEGALLAVVFAAGFVASAAAPLVVRVAPRAAGWALALAPAVVLAALLAAAPGLREGGALRAEIPWAPDVGLHLALRLDGLAALFGVLVAGVGVLVCVYAGGYLRGHAHLGRFFAFLLLFMGAMLGVALADNLLLLYVCWEVTTIASWLLIGYEHEEDEARHAAWQALIVTTLGGLAMLAAFVLMGQSAQTYEVSVLLERGEAVRSGGAHGAILALVLVGAAAKSALVPLHFWLPNAMEAPTPVSAYLHSATMVTLGVFLLARLSPVLAEGEAWTAAVAGIGGVTAVVAAWMALVQADLKRLLAYSTISALGIMTLALGVAGAEAARAALALLFAHALYKGALFMVAGSIDHGAGSRVLGEVGGLWRAMPGTAIASVLAMVSMVALPPTLGFIAEEEVLGVAEEEAKAGHWAILAAVLAWGTLYTAAGFVAGLRPFVGRQRSPQEPHETGFALWGPPLLMGAGGIVLAALPGALDRALIEPATRAVAGETPEEHLKLWHGVTPSLLMGLAMLVVGGALAAAWGPLRRGAMRLGAVRRAGPDRLYGSLETGLRRGAERLDRWLQHGYLPAYLVIVLVTVLGLAVPPLWRSRAGPPVVETPIELSDLALVVVTLGAALGAALARGRVVVIACMSLVGYGVALLFASFGGADLAITQVLVETLLTVLVVLLLPAMPRFEPISRGIVRLGDAVLCVAVGALVSVLLLGATAVGEGSPVADYYRAHSEDWGGGKNIVNTVLVNFRAADTLGEIAVLWVAALGVAILLADKPSTPLGESERGSLVLAIASRVLLPLVMVFAVYLLVIGHSSPGGGFAAGLVLGVGLVIMLLASPQRGERELLWLHPRTLGSLGLALAAASGAWGLVAGGSLLEARWLGVELGVLGGMHLGTPLLFDLGVCLVAAGALFTLIRILEEHSPWKS